MKRILILVIDFYRAFLSPYKPPTCKYTPSCSEYASEAIKKKGALRGLLLCFKRILKCNPFSKGGYDPI